MRLGKYLIEPNLIHFPVPFTKHKFVEIEVFWGNQGKFFECNFKITRKQDHAGARFNLTLFKLFALLISLYDHRHWNKQENRWAKPGEF